MPVLLFDIDGTLLQSHGVGRRSVTAALADLVGDTFDFSDVTFSGKTDPQIFREVLEAAGRHGLAVEGATPEAFLSLYEREMAARLPSATVEALPGAVALVRRLAGDGAEIGLLTGNIEAIAYDKVARIDLGRELFPFGAFGSDHADRDALPAIGARRATAHLGRTVETSELVILGDTPRDIACAHAAGAVAVAVATGRYSADELSGADVVLDTLEGFSLDMLRP
ncbi:HAD family hydrolase [Rubrivirga sp. IMCC43871]|uniref:HAD family hydrolase n=1 Tax=Rubrivirga sp. IMCC43871 TaxID=3391575 RepID=UPI00398F927B